MVGIFQFFEDRAIKKYLRKLDPILRKRYGGTGAFTFAQVKRTLEDYSMNPKFADYAYFVFCLPEEYAEYGGAIKEVKRYEGYRDSVSQIGAVCGHGREGICGGGGGGD